LFHKIIHTALIVLAIAILTPAFSQTDDEESLRKSALELFENELYEEAFPLYSQLLSLNLASADYNYHFGACQLFYGHNKEKALQFLKYAVEQKEIPPLAYFYYGLGLHLNYRFDKAIDYYQKYKGLASKKDRELQSVDNYLKQCRNGKMLVSNFTDISVLQREVLPISDFYRNYDLTDFGGKIIVKPEEFMSNEDIKRDANFLMYFQKDADLIYYASYSDKNQTGKDLYFISKLPTGGWSKASKLDDIVNTELDEDFPFIRPGGNILYFASKGHNSMGGYDIFKSTRNGDGSWTIPINMEFAINTPWDDYMFITDKNEKTAWFSSNRETSGKEVTVYKIGIQRVQLDLTLLKGSFESESSKKATITIEDMVQNKTIGVFETDGFDGSYLLDIKGSGKYKFIVEAEESNKIHTGIVEIPRQKGLKQFSQEMKLIIVNGEEQLQIINHFDTPIEDESLVTADILKKQASLKINSDESSIESSSKPLASEESNQSTKSKPQRLAEAKNKLAELEGDADLMKQKATYLFNVSKEKGNSTEPEEIAEAAIALELANIYIQEADKRAEAAKTMSTKIQLVENDNLGDDAFNAQINQANTIGNNFGNLEDFEEQIPVQIEERVASNIDAYDKQVANVNQLKSDLKGIDEEIEYLKAESENTKDKELKAEYLYQVEDAERAIPVKKEGLAKAELKAKELEVAKNNASAYVAVSEKLLGKANNEGENSPASITSKDIATAKDKLVEKAKSNAALYAILSPNAGANLSESTQTSLGEKGQTVITDAGSINTEIAEGSAANNKTTEQNLSEELNTESDQQSKETIATDEPDPASEELSSTIINDQLKTPGLAENTQNQSSSPEALNTETDETSEDNNKIAEQNQSEELPTEVEQPSEETEAVEQITEVETGNETEDINDAIREIEASESTPDIINGDYNTYFEDQIAQASQAEDPMIAESRKAELYDQWTDNINYRIDSLDQKIETSDDNNQKLKLVNEVSELKSELVEKEDLSMASYQAIAELSDAQANEPATTDVANGNVTQVDVEKSSTPVISTAPANEVERINIKYQQQLEQAQSITESLERKTQEAAVNSAWSSELEDQIDLLNVQIEESTDETEKAELEELLGSAEKTQKEKERKFETLQKQAQAIAAGENEQVTQQEFEATLEEYVENYDRKAFVRLEGNININPDENQRLVQTNTMTRNWMISLRNEIIKTEARKRQTNDPKQIAQINERLVVLEKDKIEVQAKLDSLDANSNLDAPRASANVLIKGSERFEGYENVIDNQTVEQLDQNVEEKTESYNDLADRVTYLQTQINNDPKKSEREELEEQLINAEENLEFAKIDKESAIREQSVINNVESDLLQMTAGQDTPAEREQKLANEKLVLAEQKTVTAQTLRNDAQAIKKKSEREPALGQAEEKMDQARLLKHEADLAESLAERTLAIEEKAITENFIIPRGKEAVLPVVNRTLNPNEQADIKATSEFQAHDIQLKKVAVLIEEAKSLEQQELTLQEQAQTKLGEVTASSPAERAVQTKDAYDLFEKADNLSARRAIKIREAAFIENEANKALLTRPEEVYMNVLAYYNTLGQPTSSATMLAENGSNPPINDIAEQTDGTLSNVSTSNNQQNRATDSNDTNQSNGTIGSNAQNALAEEGTNNGQTNSNNGNANTNSGNVNNGNQTNGTIGSNAQNALAEEGTNNGQTNSNNGNANTNSGNVNNGNQTNGTIGSNSQNGLAEEGTNNGQTNSNNGNANTNSGNVNNGNQANGTIGSNSQNGLAEEGTNNGQTNSNNGNANTDGGNVNNGNQTNGTIGSNSQNGLAEEGTNNGQANSNNGNANTDGGNVNNGNQTNGTIGSNSQNGLAEVGTNNGQTNSNNGNANTDGGNVNNGNQTNGTIGSNSQNGLAEEGTNNGQTNSNNGNANTDGGKQAANTSEPFNLLPPTVAGGQNKPAGTSSPSTPGRLKVTDDILTNTIFDLEPDASNNINGASNRTSSTASQAIPIDPEMPAGVVYKIQLGAFSKPIDASRFKGIKPIVGERTASGYIRYTAGQFPDFVSADAAKDELREIGFPDAFVVGYQNGIRASVEQTKQFEGKPANQVPTPSRPGIAAANRNTNNSSNSNNGGNIPSGIITRGALKITDVNTQDKVFYTVQVGVYARKVTSAEVYNITPLNQEQMSNGNYRYSTGVYDNFTTADQAKQEVRKIGVSDAFVVAYRSGSRISVADARTELNDKSPAYTGFTTPVATAPVVNNTPAKPLATQPPVISKPETTEAVAESGEAKYNIFIGRYNGEVPIEVASVLLSISDQITKKRDILGSSYFYGRFVTEQEAKAEAQRLQNLGLTNASVERLK
jgi:hypothetical protein